MRNKLFSMVGGGKKCTIDIYLSSHVYQNAAIYCALIGVKLKHVWRQRLNWVSVHYNSPNSAHQRNICIFND